MHSPTTKQSQPPTYAPLGESSATDAVTAVDLAIEQGISISLIRDILDWLDNH